NNIGGTISALKGAINVRDALFAASSNTDLSGGNWLSQTLNINGGNGAVTASLGQVTGLVNITAASAHFLAETPDLQFGQLNITGDPTFFNANGSINISNFSATPGAALTIAASQDVVISGGSISTTPTTSGSGQDILIVAGVNFVSFPSGGGT